MFKMVAINKNFTTLRQVQILASDFFESKRVFLLRDPKLTIDSGMVVLMDGNGRRGYVMSLPVDGNNAFFDVDGERNKMREEGCYLIGALVYHPSSQVSGFVFRTRAGRGM